MHVKFMFEQINNLKEHEQTDPLRLEEVKVILLKDKFQRDPIIVDEGTNVVIDGHHRLNALKILGYSKVAVHYVNYFNDERIIVKTWYPLLIGSRKKLMKLLYGKIENAQSKRNPKLYGEFIIKNRIYSLKVRREIVMRSVVGEFRVEYAFTSKFARRLALNGKVAGAFIFKSVTKKDVIDRALAEKKYPPKTTQHIIPNKPRMWYIPLRKLR